MQVPEMKEFGSVLKSSIPVELTEAETEYVVSVVKHIFKEHIVLQYDVKNTLPDTVLENVSVVAQAAEEDELEEVFILQAEKLPTDEPGKVYVAFQKVNGEGSLPVSQFSNILKFTSKEIDPSTGEPEETGYEDEYEVAEFELSGSDYVIPTFASNFSHIWEQIGASGEEAQETMQLSGVKSLAGKFSSPGITMCCCNRWDLRLTMSRRNGAAPQGAIPPGARGHGRADQPDDAHAEAARQDGERRAGSGEHPDGVLGQVRGHDEDYRAKRGGGRRGTGGCVCCLSPGIGYREQVFMGWRWKNEYTNYLSSPHPEFHLTKFARVKTRAGREIVFVRRIYSHNSCIKLSLVLLPGWSVWLGEDAQRLFRGGNKWGHILCIYRCMPPESRRRAKFLPDRLWFSYRLSANHLRPPHFHSPFRARLTLRYPVATEQALLYPTVLRGSLLAGKPPCCAERHALHPLWAGP